MYLKSILSAGAMAIVLGAAGVAGAVSLQTTSFLTTVTNFNGFQGSGGNFPNNTYSEDGITVEYIGTAEIIDFSVFGGGGSTSWYENGGGNGYTRVTRTDGADFSAIQFLLGSGWGDGATLQFQVLNDSVVLFEGNGGAADACCALTDYRGFSGGVFDEIRLQVQNDGSPGFDANAYEAGAYDSFAIGASAPEPAAWALMIGGFGLAGGMLRRRKAALA